MKDNRFKQAASQTAEFTEVSTGLPMFQTAWEQKTIGQEKPEFCTKTEQLFLHEKCYLNQVSFFPLHSGSFWRLSACAAAVLETPGPMSSPTKCAYFFLKWLQRTAVHSKSEYR